MRIFKLFLPVLFLLGAAGCLPAQTEPAGDPALEGPSQEQPAQDRDVYPEVKKVPPQKRVKEIEGLVRLADFDAGFIFDLKYATEDNFMGRIFYPAAVAVLKKETAERLLQANAIFRSDGYSIKIWDAYRPLSVQRVFWQACPDSRFVSNPDPLPPAGGWKARHYNGMSVDLTLVDATGCELQMPTAFDDFSEKAAPDYPGMSDEARRNVQYLQRVMESAGFAPISTEWWHFNDAQGTPTPYLDIPLEDFLE
jgi:D-alanyl-D-alanine dipeptidase